MRYGKFIISFITVYLCYYFSDLFKLFLKVNNGIEIDFENSNAFKDIYNFLFDITNHYSDVVDTLTPGCQTLGYSIIHVLVVEWFY